MEVACQTCSRTFSVDDVRASRAKSARCVCGNILTLVPDPSRQRLGQYLLERRIAVGGMGEIYRAKVAGVEGFERIVAIKKMLPHLSADRDFVNMLVKEAKLTVLLNHPNIVQVYDLAKEGDEYYIAMEYVPAINVGHLLDYCRENAILPPVPVVLHIIGQVLKGLAYAHALHSPDGQHMQVLHRDITPQNILVTREGWVKITDFGIAKARNEISTTSPGMIKGKLGYIAPEQLSGVEPDQRVDIFCCGIMLWECLAVRRLFKGQDELDTFRLINEAKVPSFARIRPDVSEAVEAVIRKALARDLSERYENADAFYRGIAEAIFPETPDDCAQATRDFLAAHPAMFERVVSPVESEVTDAQTVSLTPTAAIKTPEIAPITDLIEKPKGKSSRRLLWVAALAVIMLSAAAGAWVMRGRMSARLAPPAVAAVTSTTPESTKPPPDNTVDKPTKARERTPKPEVREKPKPLSPEEIQTTVQRYFAPLAKCLQKLDAATAPSKVSAKLTVNAAGRVTSTDLSPSLGVAAVEKCLSSTFRSMKFRASPEGFEITVPLQIQRFAGQ